MADRLHTTDLPTALFVDNLDIKLQDILSKRDNDTRQSIEEDIIEEFSIDALLKERKGMFDIAKKKFEIILQDEGTLETNDRVDIEIMKRTKTYAVEKIVKELVDMYDYSIGYTEIFPKAVISNSSKYIDISEKEIGRGRSQIYNPVLDRMRLTEMSNMIKQLQSDMQKLLETKAEDRSRIIALEQKVVILEGQVKLNSPNTNQGEKERQSPATTLEERESPMPQPPSTEEAESPSEQSPSTGAVISTPTAATAAAKSTTTTTAETGGQQQHDRRHLAASQPANRGVSRIQGEDGQMVTVIHRGNSLAKDIAEKVLEGRSPLINNQEEFPPLPQRRPAGNSSNSRESTTSRPYRGNPPPRTANRTLTGLQPEKGISVYVKNIWIDSSDSDKDIGQMIESHCHTKKLRLMF